METSLPLQEWLNQEPAPEDIRTNEDGSFYIPIEIIKPKLDYLSSSWETKNFHHFFFQTEEQERNGEKFSTLKVSGSVELIVAYVSMVPIDLRNPQGGKVSKYIVRTITGSATFDTQKYYGNPAWGQTCLSLCIVAAAKELGPTFGKNLNKDRLTIPSIENEPKRPKKQILKAMDAVTKNFPTR